MARNPELNLGKIFVFGSCRVGDAARCLAICGYDFHCAGPRIFTLPDILTVVGQFADGGGSQTTSSELIEVFRSSDRFIVEISSLRTAIKSKELIDENKFISGVEEIVKLLDKPIVFVCHVAVPFGSEGAISQNRFYLRDYLTKAAILTNQTFFDPTTVITPSMMADRDHYNERGAFAVASALIQKLSSIK